jgi:hypothetical protein
MSLDDAKITKLTAEFSVSKEAMIGNLPVFLYVPKNAPNTHHHIVLDKEAAYKLLVWLEDTRLDWT